MHRRYAFTLIEVVFVMVILGIVASIGSKIIADVYQTYLVQRAQYRASIKTELALDQIANRLRAAIPGTIVARSDLNGTAVAITNIANANLRVLQWVGYDIEGFEAESNNYRPGWSGFADVTPSSASTIFTPGSDLDFENTVIQNLSYGTKTIGDAYLYFPVPNIASNYYLLSSNSSDQNFTLQTAIPNGRSIYERYKLAWSSYALEVNGNGDLILHYNFPAIPNAAIRNDQSDTLLKRVTVFRFKGSEGAMRIKLCKREIIDRDFNLSVHICKEKVVF